MKKLFEKLKHRWAVENSWQVALILFIFSITGLTALYIRKFVFELLGYTASTPFWEQAITWVIVVFPSYQILFLLYGFLLGQFEFVWKFEKKNFLKLKRLLLGNYNE